MLGGANCIMSGGNNKNASLKNMSSSFKNAGAKKKTSEKKKTSAKKKASVKKAKKKTAGSLCIGNLHPFEASDSYTASTLSSTNTLFNTENNQLATQQHMTNANLMDGGAKKSKKSKKSRKAGPYAKFVKKHYASVQKKNPSWKATDCMKEIAKMWKSQKNK